MGGRGAFSGIRINSRIKYYGRPNLINIISKADLNNRQKKLLENLKNKGDYIKVKKSDVSLKDISALTAKENVEFSIFTRGSSRIVIRGNKDNANPNKELADEIVKFKYRFSGHTHIGNGGLDLFASDGDYETLSFLGQKQSVIYNSAGQYRTFKLWSEYEN